MSLTFIGLSKDAKGSQIRTAGVWNIAVAIQRLIEELELARKESDKPAPPLAAELSDCRNYSFVLRSGATVTGRPATISAEWIVVEGADGTRAFLAVDCIESITEKIR